MNFKRKLCFELLEWKNISDGSTAFVIEGARRIGKSTLAEIFAKQEYKDYLILDFAKAPPKVLSLFDKYNTKCFRWILRNFYGLLAIRQQQTLSEKILKIVSPLTIQFIEL